MIDVKLIPHEYRETSEEQIIKGGQAVIVVDPEVWKWGGLKPYSVGIVGGSFNPVQEGQARSITFNTTPYRDGYVECSGGPGTVATPAECLKPTGLQVKRSFWRFRNGEVRAHNGEYYDDWVDLFLWYQSEEEAESKREEINQKEFNQFKPEYELINCAHCQDWIRDDNGEPLYWATYSRFKADLKDIKRRFDQRYIVTPVYFKEHGRPYDDNKKGWFKYFKQLMIVDTAELKCFPYYVHNFHKQATNPVKL